MLLVRRHRGTSTQAFAPTGLTATGISSTEIVLSWDQAPDATGYALYRSSVPGGPYTLVTPLSGSTTTTDIDSGLSPNTTYYYVVEGTNYNGPSADSTEASGTTLGG